MAEKRVEGILQKIKSELQNSGHECIVGSEGWGRAIVTIDGHHIGFGIEAYDTSIRPAVVLIKGRRGYRRTTGRYVAKKGTLDDLNYPGIAKRLLEVIADKKKQDAEREIAHERGKRDDALAEELIAKYPQKFFKVAVFEGKVDLTFRPSDLPVEQAEKFLAFAVQFSASNTAEAGAQS